MNGNRGGEIPCDHCSGFHPVGTIFCPQTGKLLQANEKSNKIRMLDDDQICDEVLSILNKYNGENRQIRDYLHVAPGEIPKKKLKNVIKKCKLKQEEIVLGIIDLSFRGSAKSCLVFAKKGIYYNNFWGSKEPGTNFIDYRHFGSCKFQLEEKEKYEISMLGDQSLDVTKFSNSDEVKDDIVDILESIKGKIIIQ